MGIIKCECGKEIQVTPIKTVTLDDIEHIKDTEPGAYELVRDAIDIMARCQSIVVGSITLAYQRGRFHGQEDAAKGDWYHNIKEADHAE